MINKIEFSAGVILFREQKGKRQYLILKYYDEADYWGLSKGIIERGETASTAALREAKEETSLENIQLISNFKEKTHYLYKQNGKTIHKEVTWFLGRVLDEQDATTSEEHEELRWVTYSEALTLLKYKNYQDLITKAEKFLNRK